MRIRSIAAVAVTVAASVCGCAPANRTQAPAAAGAAVYAPAGDQVADRPTGGVPPRPLLPATPPAAQRPGPATRQAVAGARPMFPLGPRLISRADIAGTLRMRPEVLDAVVITEGERAFVAVQTADGEVLSPQMRRTLQKSVRRFAPGVGRVFVASSPEAFADFAAYARYLQSNRQVGGMLLTWRSILQKNWPDEFDQG